MAEIKSPEDKLADMTKGINGVITANSMRQRRFFKPIVDLLDVITAGLADIETQIRSSVVETIVFVFDEKVDNTAKVVVMEEEEVVETLIPAYPDSIYFFADVVLRT